MGDCELEMEGQGDHVGDKYKNNPLRKSWDAAIDKEISEPGPEKYLSRELEQPVPAMNFGAKVAEDEVPGEVV